MIAGSRKERIESLKAAIRERVLVLDGAMGTLLQAENLKAADFGGPELEGCNENLVLTRPELIQRIHADYYSDGPTPSAQRPWSWESTGWPPRRTRSTFARPSWPEKRGKASPRPADRYGSPARWGPRPRPSP